MSAKKLQRMKKVCTLRTLCIAIQLMGVCRGKAGQKRSMGNLDYYFSIFFGLDTHYVLVHYAYNDTHI